MVFLQGRRAETKYHWSFGRSDAREIIRRQCCKAKNILETREIHFLA